MKNFSFLSIACAVLMTTASVHSATAAAIQINTANTTIAAGQFNADGYIIKPIIGTNGSWVDGKYVYPVQDSFVVTLDNVGEVTTNGSAFLVEDGAKLVLFVNGNNDLRVAASNDYSAGIAVHLPSKLYMRGDGTLRVNAGSNSRGADIGGSGGKNGRSVTLKNKDGADSVVIWTGQNGNIGKNGQTASEYPKAGGRGADGAPGFDVGYIEIDGPTVMVNRMGGGDGDKGGDGGRGGHGSIDERSKSDCSLACHSGANGGDGGDGGKGGNGGTVMVFGGALEVNGPVRAGNGGQAGRGGVGGTKTCNIDISAELAAALNALVQIAMMVGPMLLQSFPPIGSAIALGIQGAQMAMQVTDMVMGAAGKKGPTAYMTIAEYHMKNGDGGNGGNSQIGGVPSLYVYGGVVNVSGGILGGLAYPGPTAEEKKYDFDFSTTCWAGKTNYEFPGKNAKNGEEGYFVTANDAYVGSIVDGGGILNLSGGAYAPLSTARCEMEFSATKHFSSGGYYFNGNCPVVKITMNNMGARDTLLAGIMLGGRSHNLLLDIHGYNRMKIRTKEMGGIAIRENDVLTITGDGELDIENTEGGVAIGGRDEYMTGRDVQHAGQINIMSGTIKASKIGGGKGATGNDGVHLDKAEYCTADSYADTGRVGSEGGRGGWINIYGGTLKVTNMVGGDGGDGGMGGNLEYICQQRNGLAGHGGNGGNGGRGPIENILGDGSIEVDTIRGGNGGNGGSGGLVYPIEVPIVEYIAGNGGNGGNGGYGAIVTVWEGNFTVNGTMQASNGGNGGYGGRGGDASRENIIDAKGHACKAASGGHGGYGGDGGGGGGLIVYGGDVHVNNMAVGNGGDGGRAGEGGSRYAVPAALKQQFLNSAAGLFTSTVTTVITVTRAAHGIYQVAMLSKASKAFLAFETANEALKVGESIDDIAGLFETASKLGDATKNFTNLSNFAVGMNVAGAIAAVVGLGLSIAQMCGVGKVKQENIENLGLDGMGGNGGNGGNGSSQAPELYLLGGNVKIMSISDTGRYGLGGQKGNSGVPREMGETKDLKRKAPGNDGIRGTTTTPVGKFVIEGGSVILGNGDFPNNFPTTMMPKNTSNQLVYKNVYMMQGMGNRYIEDGLVDTQWMSLHKYIYPNGYGIYDTRTDERGRLFFWLPAVNNPDSVWLIMDNCYTYLTDAERPAIYESTPPLTRMPTGIKLNYQKGNGVLNPVPMVQPTFCGENIVLPYYTPTTNGCAVGYHSFWQVFRDRVEREYFFKIDDDETSNTRGSIIAYHRDSWIENPVFYRGGQTNIRFYHNDTLHAYCVPDTSFITFDYTGGFREGVSFGEYTYVPNDTLTAVYNGIMPHISSQYNGSSFSRKPIRSGYTFLGYYDTPEGAGNIYYDSEGLQIGQRWNKAANTNHTIPPANPTISPYGKYTLYARWKPDTTTLYFDENGGTPWQMQVNVGSSTTTTKYHKKVVYAQPMPAIDNLPTRTGYVLTGVWTNPTGGEKYYEPNGTSPYTWQIYDKPIDTLYAQWQEYVYHVRYELNGGSAPAPAMHIDIPYRGSITIKDYAGTRYGYTFNGWTSDPNYANLNMAGFLTGRTITLFDMFPANADSAINLPANGDTVVLYAVWKSQSATVVFNNTTTVADITGGQKPFPHSINAVYGSLLPVLSDVEGNTCANKKVPCSPNGSFAGYWDLNKEMNSSEGNMYYDMAGNPAKKWDKPVGTYMLYARWSNISYNVEYKIRCKTEGRDVPGKGIVPGECNEPAPQGHYNVHFGENIVMKNYNGTNTGKIFRGWTTSQQEQYVASYLAGDDAYNLSTRNGDTVFLYDIWGPDTTKVIVNPPCPPFCGGGGNASIGMGGGSRSALRSTQANMENNTQSTGFNILYGQAMSDIEHLIQPVTITGYTFKGYYAEHDVLYFDSLAHGVFDVWTDTLKVVQISPKMVANKYTIKYNTQGGSDIPNPQSGVEYDKTISLQPYTGTKFGYRFLYWSTTPNGTDTTYAAGADVKNLTAVDKDTVTLYAIWQPLTTTLAFDANGGSGGQTASLNAEYMSPMPALDTPFRKPTRRGYIFSGYATQDAATTYYNAAGNGQRTWNNPDATYTLYAQWQEGTYTIVYDIQGGSGRTPTGHTGLNYNEDLTLQTYSGTKTGYDFDGWAITAGARQKDFAVGATTQRLGEAGVTVTLYAAWKPKTTNMTYNPNEGKFPIEMTRQIVAEYGRPMPSFVIFPIKTGYEFRGFYDQATNGTMYYDEYGSSVKNWDKIVGEATMYARWQAKTTTLRFNTSGGVGGPLSAVVVNYGQPLPNYAPPVKVGYIFLGYYDQPTGGEMYYDSITAQRTKAAWDKTLNQATLYARWRPKTSALTFNPNGGVGGPQDMLITFGEDLPLLPYEIVPTRKHYHFNGYYDHPQYGVMYYTYAITPTRKWNKDEPSITLYAHWYGVQYNIYYKNIPMGIIGAIDDTYIVGEGKELTVPRHAQYAFEGFYADSMLTGQKIERITPQDTSDKLLYARWVYSVGYDKNGGTGTDLPVMLHTYTRTDNTFSPVPGDWTRYGYEPCLGWSTSPTAEQPMFPVQGGSAADLPVNQKVTLYAVWQPKATRVILSSAVSVDANGLAAASPEVMVKYEMTMPELTALQIPSRSGYIFAGYYDAVEGGTQYYTSSGIGTKVWDKVADEITLYAHWSLGHADNLTGLRVSDGKLIPSFSPNVYDYKLVLPCDEVILSLNYPTGNTAAVNGTAVAKDYVIAANTAAKTLRVEVISPEKAAVQYTINVDAPLPSSNILYSPDVAPRNMEVSADILNNPDYTAYQWQEDGVALPDAVSGLLFRAAGFKTGALYSVTIYANNGDSIRICPRTGEASRGGDSKTLEAFPNPASTAITLTHPELGKETSVVRIYTTSGSLVISHTADRKPDDNSTTIDISSLPAGSYIVRVLNSSTMIVKQ
jgi:uncharacterized repeat protein (TIGR02543 family)